jgi:hypothetical protein
MNRKNHRTGIYQRPKARKVPMANIGLGKHGKVLAKSIVDKLRGVK